ncbi:MAG: hypothetical protein WD558_09435 [Pseudomonadales bacterium]
MKFEPIKVKRTNEDHEAVYSAINQTPGYSNPDVWPIRQTLISII